MSNSEEELKEKLASVENGIVIYLIEIILTTGGKIGVRGGRNELVFMMLPPEYQNLVEMLASKIAQASRQLADENPEELGFEALIDDEGKFGKEDTTLDAEELDG